jgi:hypothetical protein
MSALEGWRPERCYRDQIPENAEFLRNAVHDSEPPGLDDVMPGQADTVSATVRLESLDGSAVTEFSTHIPREVIERLQRPFQRSEYAAVPVPDDIVARFEAHIDSPSADGLALLRAASDAVRAARESGVPEELQRLPGERADDWRSAYDRLQSIPPDWRRITMVMARAIVLRGFTVDLAYAVNALIGSMTFMDPPEAPPDWLMRMPSPAWNRRARNRSYDLEQAGRGHPVPDRNKGWYMDRLYSHLPEMVVLAERVRGRLCFHPDAVVQHRVLEQQSADDTLRTVLTVRCPRCDAFMSQLVPEGSSVELAMGPALLPEDDYPQASTSVDRLRRAVTGADAAVREFSAVRASDQVISVHGAQREQAPMGTYGPVDPEVFETEPHDGYCPMIVEGSSLPDDLTGWVR